MHSKLLYLKRLEIELEEVNRQAQKTQQLLRKAQRIDQTEKTMIGILRKQTEKLEILKNQDLPLDSFHKAKRKIQSVRRIVCKEKIETLQNQALIGELQSSIHSPRSGSPSKRAPGRFNMGGGFNVGEAIVLQEFPILDKRRAQSDRGKHTKTANLALPLAPRPKTVRIKRHNTIQALLTS
jgi:hypothetical protein